MLMHRTVFIYGYFDLLPAGHIELLKFYDLFRRLIGSNSDASTNRLKGLTRPIIPQSEHFITLKAIQFGNIWASNSVA